MATEAKKARLKEQRNKQLCEVSDFCETHGFEQVHITEYQVRINGILDVYPTSMKFCILKTKHWGQYYKVEDLLKHLQ